MAVQESTYVTIVTESMKGYMAITLDEWDTTAEPVLKEGGRFELSGSLFKITADEDIDPDNNFAGFPNSTQVYGYFVEAAGVTKSVLTTTAPAWEDQKQGWYDATSTYRYWGGIYKDSGGNYADKFIYAGRSLKHSNNCIITERGNIDLSGATNADRHIDFASDARQLWDESEDYFSWNKPIKTNEGRIPSGSLHSTELVTENTIYNALSTYIPSVNDEIIIVGAGSKTTIDLGGFDFNYIYILNRAKRTDSDTIKIYYLMDYVRSTNGGSFNYSFQNALDQDIDNGSANVPFGKLSMSW